MTWLTENIGTIVIAFALVCVVAIIVVNMIRNKRAGKSSCGCGCSDCPMSGKCHDNSIKKKDC